jgi:hypothetical protein
MTIIQEIISVSMEISLLTRNSRETEIQFVDSIWTRRSSNYLTRLLFLGEKLNIFEINQEKIRLTNNGRLLLEKCTIKNGNAYSDENSEQMNFLKEEFWNTEKILDDFKKMLKYFFEYNSHADMKCVIMIKTSTGEITTPPSNDKLFADRFTEAYLEEIGIFERKDEINNRTGDVETVLYCKNFAKEVSKIRNNVKEVTEEELAKKIAENKEIGNEGEEEVLKTEREKFREEGRIDLSMTIKQESVTNAYAGYDIKSYEDKNSKLIEYDKLIEVKTTRSTSPRFFWSSNEIKVAKREGEKYWIYLWTNWNSSKKSLEKIQNPYKRFFIDSTEEPKCTGYFFDKI